MIVWGLRTSLPAAVSRRPEHQPSPDSTLFVHRILLPATLRQEAARMHIKQVVISGFRSFRSQTAVEPFRFAWGADIPHTSPALT